MLLLKNENAKIMMHRLKLLIMICIKHKRELMIYQNLPMPRSLN